MEAKSTDAEKLFSVFTACPDDIPTLLLDVRSNKDYKKKHINQAFNVRLSTNGKVLADYSQASYKIAWSQDCWWAKHVLVYGPAGLSKDHPVVSFLAKEGRCASLHYYKDGFGAFESIFPFLCTPSVKANSIKKYPSVIIPRLLFLGHWGDAEDAERLTELKIKRVVTIHNHPSHLKPPSHMKHLQLVLADVDSADISQHFNTTYEFINEGMQNKEATLVHCGAGVSRSATLVMMFLMRARTWSAQRAKDFVTAARSMACPNDGFWRVMCALEGSLGIMDRSDPNATMGYHGIDAPTAADLSADAAGLRVPVVMVSTKALKAAAGAASAGARPEPQEEPAGKVREGDRGARSRSRSRDRGREKRMDRSRSSGRRSRSRERRYRSTSRDRRRSRSRDRDRGRNRSRSRGRGRSKSKSREKRNERGRDRGWEQERAGGGAADGGRTTPPMPTVPTGGSAAAPQQQQQQGVFRLEVSKSEGLVGHLLLGPFTVHQKVIFGRAPSCDVVLEHLSISRQHAQVMVDSAGKLCVMDLGSGHGTKLGDAWLKAHQPREVHPGAVLRFGASTRTYRLLPPATAG